MRADVLERHQQEWEELASVDPLWAILTGPEHRGGRWELAEFFDTGETEISEVLTIADDLGEPVRRIRALDFGCGVGRLTRALSSRFRESVGLDISEGMLKLARELNEDRPSCEFVVNAAPDLGLFESDSFDFVYSSLVLQHMPSPEVVESYVGEFLRVLRPGGLAVFQMLSHIPLALRLQPRRRVYAFLRTLGLSEQMLLMQMKLTPARGLAVSEAEMRQFVERHGGTLDLVEAYGERAAREHVRSTRYFARAT
ncbi:MAG: class I SAM-dependent methyltransferase [Actinomycetota bacterium]